MLIKEYKIPVNGVVRLESFCNSLLDFWRFEA